MPSAACAPFTTSINITPKWRMRSRHWLRKSSAWSVLLQATWCQCGGSADMSRRHAPVTDEAALFAEGQALHAKMAADAKRRFDRGDKGAILEAIFHCALGELPLADWPRDAFMRAYTETKVGPPLHRSWDVVFATPHEKHEKLHAKLLAGALRWRVYIAVLDLRAKQPHKDHFPAVAARFGIGEALCRKYFRQAQRIAKVPKYGARHAKWMI